MIQKLKLSPGPASTMSLETKTSLQHPRCELLMVTLPTSLLVLHLRSAFPRHRMCNKTKKQEIQVCPLFPQTSFLSVMKKKLRTYNNYWSNPTAKSDKRTWLPEDASTEVTVLLQQTEKQRNKQTNKHTLETKKQWRVKSNHPCFRAGNLERNRTPQGLWGEVPLSPASLLHVLPSLEHHSWVL